MTRYRAHFAPEASVRGNIIEIDANGPQDWDCTAFALANPDYLLDLWSWSEQAGLGTEWSAVDRWDYFIDDPEAPEWAKAHARKYPFTITIYREEE